ncbi:EamA-like transporter family protein [Nitzschia inconspicua]|uniref:EamA-like transporter family protein n=1 Tax=Nitzschia inconspicua TaxID=303405 RepID=A0A9K3L288_9STRA|nr:EamA-like transporter family protein [Nitzschia inconspicua]
MLYRLRFLLLFSVSCVYSLTPTRLPSTRGLTSLRMSEITTTTPFEKSKSTFRRNFTDDMNDFSKDDEDDDYNLSSSSSSWVFPAPNLQYPGIGALPNDNNSSSEYQRGLVTIGFITLLFSSNSPVLHAAFSPTDATTTGPPPVLLLNAAVSVVALVGLLLGGDSLEYNALRPSALQERTSTEPEDALALQGGCELGLWKFLGTTANLYGLALTTAGHGALLIQLTTLIVPVVQGIQGVPIPKRIQASVILALAGVFCFTQDPTGTPSAQGDALCVLAAIFYATYDLRLFAWGKKLAAKRLITTKIATQAILSVSLLLAVSRGESMEYLASADATTWSSILPAVVWSGVAVNAVAPFLQVGGQQAVGPTRCQTIYASQPLWAAILSFLFLGETIGSQGLIGGSVFLVALFLAATAEAPQADCGETNCEI